MYRLLNEIQFHVIEAYNQELVELKQQLESLQLKLQSIKGDADDLENDIYRKYASIMQKIFIIQNPF